MSFPASKTFALSAGLFSVMAVSMAQPADALTIRLSTNPVFTDKFRFTTQQLDFNNLAEGPFETVTYNDEPVADLDDSNRVVITDTSSGPNGNVTVGSNGTNRFFQFAPQGGANVSQLTFDFDNRLAYFGVRFLNFGTNLNSTVSFLNGANPVISYTLSELANLSGTGNYFNFYAPLVSDRFTQVVINGQNLRLDDVAYRIPTPALLPGLVGMGITALRNRKQTEAEEV